MSIDMPVIAGKFRMPEPRRDLNMVYAGQSFVKEAEQLNKEFIQHRLPEDFIEKLNTAVEDLKAAMLEQAQQKEARANARKEIENTMKTCLMLLQRIDAIVVNTLADKPAINAEWEVTRRVIRKPAVKSRKPQTQPDAKPETQPEVGSNPETLTSTGAASAATA